MVHEEKLNVDIVSLSHISQQSNKTFKAINEIDWRFGLKYFVELFHHLSGNHLSSLVCSLFVLQRVIFCTLLKLFLFLRNFFITLFDCFYSLVFLSVIGLKTFIKIGLSLLGKIKLSLDAICQNLCPHGISCLEDADIVEIFFSFVSLFLDILGEFFFTHRSEFISYSFPVYINDIYQHVQIKQKVRQNAISSTVLIVKRRNPFDSSELRLNPNSHHAEKGIWK